MMKNLVDTGDLGDISYGMKIPKLVPVSGGNFALVDEEDYEKVMAYSWQFSHGYAQRHMSNKECKEQGVPRKTMARMHRIICGVTANLDVDHINTNGLDNRKSNLRPATVSQNIAWARKQFMARPDAVTTSRFKGVSWRSDRHRWTAYCGTGANRAHLGCFQSEEEAALAYNKKALEMYGEFARLNEI